MMERWGSYRGGEGALLDMKPCSGSDWSCFLADPEPAEPHLLIRARWWELILVVWFRCEARHKSTLLVSFDSPCLSCVCVCVCVPLSQTHLSPCAGDLQGALWGLWSSSLPRSLFLCLFEGSTDIFRALWRSIKRSSLCGLVRICSSSLCSPS